MIRIFGLGSLLIHQVNVSRREGFIFDQSDPPHVPIEHLSDFCDQRGHESSPLLEVPTLGIEDLLEFFNQKSSVAAFSKHR